MPFNHDATYRGGVRFSPSFCGTRGAEVMTTLYRSPSIILDAHEWHVIVRVKAGRVTKTFRWRPVAVNGDQWLPKSSWVGPMPKGFGQKMQRFKLHIDFAMRSEVRRKEAAVALGRVKPTAAMLVNVSVQERIAA
jgi:hypothetical protein